MSSVIDQGHFGLTGTGYRKVGHTGTEYRKAGNSCPGYREGVRIGFEHQVCKHTQTAIVSLGSDSAQATIEAAFAIPVLMILLLMLLQPGIYLYDRMVMASAASEGCRLLATSADDSRDICEDFIRRRLSAIPQTDIFHSHSGGCTYEIEFSGAETDGNVSLTITNRLKPLPFLDATMSLAGMTDGNGLMEITVEASSTTQPDWLADSTDGRNPSKWVQT